jgi:gliding motility-associated-like protein
MLVFPLKGVQSLHVKIYDRWGLKLYEWTDPEKGWDGNTTGGEPVPEGTYFYMIDFVDYYGNALHQAGHVQLMRN